MTDESKVKTTFIRPVNRTMSYEDRRGYVYAGADPEGGSKGSGPPLFFVQP